MNKKQTKAPFNQRTINETTGDIWKLASDYDWIVVPTNGDVNRVGHAVMGAGLAYAATLLIDGIAEELGWLLQNKGNNLFVFFHHGLITLPTKHHWQQKSDLSLIERGLIELNHVADFIQKHTSHRLDRILLPELGCGHGGLEWSEVEPLVNFYCGSDPRFLVVHYGK